MASGGSVIAVKYNGGVLMASDTLLSYGSLAKIPNAPRSVLLGKNTAICASGDYADFQSVISDVEEVYREAVLEVRGDTMGPVQIYTYMQRLLYEKRSQFQPALCTFIVIGTPITSPSTACNGFPKQGFLGVIDDKGTHWKADCAGTVFGQHMAVPLLRTQIESNGVPETKEQAVNLLERCMTVLFYRECRTLNRIQMVDASFEHGMRISEPYSLSTNFELSGFHFEKTALLA